MGNKYMVKHGIATHYGLKYDGKSPEFWKKINLPDGVDKQYVCIGVKASNYFMPAETLSDKGPGGGGWSHMNKYMQVVKKYTKEEEEWFRNLDVMEKKGKLVY